MSIHAENFRNFEQVEPVEKQNPKLPTLSIYALFWVIYKNGNVLVLFYKPLNRIQRFDA